MHLKNFNMGIPIGLNAKYANAQQSSISTGFGIGNARRGSRIQVIVIVFSIQTSNINMELQENK